MASCTRCKRPLKDEVSISRGYGPVCWTRIHNQTNTGVSKGAGIYTGGDIVLERTGEYGIRTNVPHQMVIHSPGGFEWGYGGSGPADLALNILLLFTDKETALRLYQDFKWQFVARVPREGGIIRREDILRWLHKERRRTYQT